ncbi:hypothetical protein Mapa_008424 [Marchantia paleacea]|nr:hypothetical protein Mapa_008424 [Marchantia paleacea]
MRLPERPHIKVEITMLPQGGSMMMILIPCSCQAHSSASTVDSGFTVTSQL